MNSLDTNILVYAVNAGCAEHAAAKPVYEAMLAEPSRWILADQVLFEFYRALRNPKILERPLPHVEALAQIRFLREDAGVLHCAYEARMWNDVAGALAAEAKPKSTHIFDRILAVTLLGNGVTTFHTRNTKDFAGAGFADVVNPIDPEAP